MTALRCSPCETNWPITVRTSEGLVGFHHCPNCGRMTHALNVKPISDEEAMSRKRHADFERGQLEQMWSLSSMFAPVAADEER